MHNVDDRLLKLIAVDLDGTLLTSEGKLAPRGSHLLKTAVHSGIYVLLASARFTVSVKNFCQLLGISGPIICMNGAQVYASPKGSVLASLSFPKEIGLEIADLADKNGWEISIVVGSFNHYRQRSGQAPGLLSEGRVIVANYTDALTTNPTRILTHDPEAIEGIKACIESNYADSCHIDLTYNQDGSISSLGVFPKGADKGTALELVLRRLRINKTNVMAIGDNDNDIPMFERAKISVAMGNAPEQVKRIATVTAPSNDEEGVAWALSQFLLDA